MLELQLKCFYLHTEMSAICLKPGIPCKYIKHSPGFTCLLRLNNVHGGLPMQVSAEVKVNLGGTHHAPLQRCPSKVAAQG